MDIRKYLYLLLIILFFPIGLFVMWIKMPFPKWFQWSITALCLIFLRQINILAFLLTCSILIGQKNHDNKSVNSSVRTKAEDQKSGMNPFARVRPENLRDLIILTDSYGNDPHLVLLRDSSSIQIMNHCTGELYQDSILEFKTSHVYGYASFVFKTSTSWMLTNQKLLGIAGWQPVTIAAEEYDDIIGLNNDDFLLVRNGKYSYARLRYKDKQVKLETASIPIVSENVFYSEHGIIAQCEENKNKYFRHFIIPEDSSLYDIAHIKNGTYSLSFTPNFKADSIEVASQYYNTVVCQLKGKKYLYSMERDSILDQGFTRYYKDNMFARVLIVTDTYLGCLTHPFLTGKRYGRLPISNVIDVSINENGSDAFSGYIITRASKEYLIFFDMAEISDSMVVSPELRRMMPDGFPYIKKMFDVSESGEFCFLNTERAELIAQSPDGKKTTKTALEFAAVNEGITVFATRDYWYVNPEYYYREATSKVRVFHRYLYDKIIPLRRNTLLAIRGKSKWLVIFDESTEKFLPPVPVAFSAENFTDTGGGLIIDESKNGQPDLRFLHYHSNFLRLACNRKTGEWESVPLSNQYVEGFQAQTLLLTADQTDGSTIVYSNKGDVYVFHIQIEKAMQVKDGKYMVSPQDGKVIFLSGDYLYTGFGIGSEYYVPGAIGFSLQTIRNSTIASVDFGGGRFKTILLNDGQTCR
jgi:hypothetical protein